MGLRWSLPQGGATNDYRLTAALCRASGVRAGIPERGLNTTHATPVRKSHNRSARRAVGRTSRRAKGGSIQ